MSTHDQSRENERKLRNDAASIGRELSTDAAIIKENVTQLARDAKNISRDKVQAASEYIRDRVTDLKASSTKSLEQTENFIREKPAQSVALAFFGGILAHILFGRGRS